MHRECLQVGYIKIILHFPMIKLNSQAAEYFYRHCSISVTRKIFILQKFHSLQLRHFL